MTNAPERIWVDFRREDKKRRPSDKGSSVYIGYAKDGPEDADDEYIRADLLPQLQSIETTTKVKPLVWEYHPAGKIAAPTIGHSYILDTRKKGTVVSLKGFAHFQRRFDTLDDAKAAAQADYERRIMECLE
jgi:hypothetical protein